MKASGSAGSEAGLESAGTPDGEAEGAAAGAVRPDDRAASASGLASVSSNIVRAASLPETAKLGSTAIAEICRSSVATGRIICLYYSGLTAKLRTKLSATLSRAGDIPQPCQ